MFGGSRLHLIDEDDIDDATEKLCTCPASLPFA